MKKIFLSLVLVFIASTSSVFALTKEESVEIKSYIKQGQAAIETDPKRAEEMFSAALKIERRDTALKGLGWSYWKQKQPAKALPIWQELTAKNPNDFPLWNQLAKLYVELKNMVGAENTYRQVLQKNSNNADALTGLAGILDSKRNYAEANFIYENLSKNSSVHPTRYMKLWAHSLFEERRYADALPKWEYVVASNPKDWDSKTFLARTKYHLGQYDKAIPLLKEITINNPKNVKALEIQLLYAKSKQDIEECRKILYLLIVADPRNVTNLNSLGAVLVELKEFDEAKTVFERSVALDPNQVDPLISITEISTLKGTATETSEYYKTVLLSRFPNIKPRVIHGILDSYEMGQFSGPQVTRLDFSQNSEVAISDLKDLLAKYPEDLSVQLRLARLEADRKNYNEAFKLLGRIDRAKFTAPGHEKEESSISIPALLYHRIAQFPGEGVVTAIQFEDHLKSLKKERYESISVVDLDQFYKGKGNLPKHPILITFDDAIKDAMVYADPLMAKYGFKATMFVPTHVIENKKPFFMSWNDLGTLKASGRWDLQCHSDYGHEEIPIDADNHLGRFLINRKWITEQKRLETEDEFRTRVEKDYSNCKEILQARFPGLDVIAYSFPYGDFGTESGTNSKQDVAAINLEAAKKNYAVSFVQKFPGFNIASTTPNLSMRINVRETWSGEDLLEHIQTKDPIIQAKIMRVNILADKGEEKAAIKLAQQENLQQRDPKTYYDTLSTAYEELGNNIEALRAWDQIGSTDRESELRRKELTNRLAPEAQFRLEAMSDSSERTVWKPSIHSRFLLQDHFYGKVFYEHGFYKESKSSVPLVEQKAQSDSFGIGLEYHWDDFTQLSIITGVQQFDTGSLTPLVQGETILPIANRYASFIGRVDYSSLQYAQAIHHEISKLNVRGGIIGNPTDRLYYKTTVGWRRMSDNNQITQYSARVKNTVYRPAGLYLGALFDYGDSSKTASIYYAPQSSAQALGEIGSSYRWHRKFKTNLGYRPGIGRDNTEDSIFVQEVLFNTQFDFKNGMILEAEVEYSKSPSYKAISGTFEFSTRF